jgi:calcineurin-like phosphoesterase family protein
MSIWFTSDCHFNHAPIINYASRPFQSVDDMNESLVKNWNEVVKPNDTVYVLGDFGEGKDKNKLLTIFNNLHGRKCLIVGNNDKSMTMKLPWNLIRNYFELNYLGKLFILSHYPIKYMCWNKSYKGSIHLHGHLHSTIPYSEEKPLRIDVGMDGFAYHPVNIETIMKIAASFPKRAEEIKDATI